MSADKPYSELTDDERLARALAAAKAMRKLSPKDRDRLIDGADNVIDARERFRHRMRQVAIARAYRKPTKPRGAA